MRLPPPINGTEQYLAAIYQELQNNTLELRIIRAMLDAKREREEDRIELREPKPKRKG